MVEGFTRTEQLAWGGFLKAYAQLNRLIEADLQRHAQISHIELEVLLRLAWAEGQRLRLQDLTAQSLLSQSGVSRVVERLERVGLVRRESAGEDRRGAYAVLTEAGMERFRAAAQKHVAFVRATFLSHFSQAELEQMASFWQRLRDAT